MCNKRRVDWRRIYDQHLWWNNHADHLRNAITEGALVSWVCTQTNSFLKDAPEEWKTDLERGYWKYLVLRGVRFYDGLISKKYARDSAVTA